MIGLTVIGASAGHADGVAIDQFTAVVANCADPGDTGSTGKQREDERDRAEPGDAHGAQQYEEARGCETDPEKLGELLVIIHNRENIARWFDEQMFSGFFTGVRRPQRCKRPQKIDKYGGPAQP